MEKAIVTFEAVKHIIDSRNTKESYDEFIKNAGIIATRLGIKDVNDLVIWIDDGYYLPSHIRSEETICKFFSIYRVEDLSLAVEKLDNKTWYYFRTKEDAKKYFNYWQFYFED